MRTIYILGILVLLALAVPAAPAHAGGVVTVCDEAHLLAALAGGGTVTFACSGTINLTATIRIAASTTIDGRGQHVTISGNQVVRVLRVNAGVQLNLANLTVSDARTGLVGGGIYNEGILGLDNCSLINNHAGSGGGIANLESGTVIVNNTTFRNNTAAYAGGSIFSPDNSLSVSNSYFEDNSAASHGGGIYNDDNLLTVTNSTFVGNSAGYCGGGICNGSSGTLVLRNNIFSSNSAGYGGAISNGSESGTVTVSNSTFSENAANDGASISHAYSGALTVINCTFSGNTTTGVGGGIDNRGDGALTLKNTIVADGPPGNNCAGVITDGGGNLSYPDTTCPGINADPMLGPLQDNGGPTWTMALGTGSAALDAGDDAICAAPPVNNLDQRGVTRPQGSHCDIGAVEQVSIKSIWLPAVQAR
jgi:predicted outer membrane repeat protein